MKEEKSKNKKKLLYYLILAVSVLLLVAATVLTVYFVTGDKNEVLDNPPGGDNVTPVDPVKPDDPNQSTGGEDVVKFVVPLTYESVSEEYNVIYTSKTTGWSYRHKAVDFAAAEGTAVCSMADGKIETVSLNEKTGNYIVVDHGDGLKSLYRFVEPVNGLKAGDSVKKGDKIGEVAAAYGSEAKDGTHLHLEITLNGAPKDPSSYLDLVNDEK